MLRIRVSSLAPLLWHLWLLWHISLGLLEVCVSSCIPARKKPLMLLRFSRFLCFFAMMLFIGIASARANFDLQITISNSATFSTSQLATVEAAIDYAENLWEGVLSGYQNNINVTQLAVTITSGSSFADARTTRTTMQGGFRLNTAGLIRINPGVVDIFASWDGSGPTPPNTEFQGVNYVDDILAHEVGHLLGISQSTWLANGIYQAGSGEYNGEHGLAAYRAEFDATATFVPVEQAGSSGTMNNHWDQIMRSSSQEGNPNDPWSLSPLTGITDSQGRDLGLELMTGAIDPDHGEPFLSNMTIQSLRDLGYTVVPEPSSFCLLLTAFLLNYRGRRSM